MTIYDHLTLTEHLNTLNLLFSFQYKINSGVTQKFLEVNTNVLENSKLYVSYEFELEIWKIYVSYEFEIMFQFPKSICSK